MLLDTHCHLDASEFDRDRSATIFKAQQKGVAGILIPAVHAQNFGVVRDLAHSFAQGAYAVGIHPMYVAQAADDDLARLEAFLIDHQADPRLVAVGEIGLDFFVPELREGLARERQIQFYKHQLRLAVQFQLPVLLHVRRSQDELLKWLRPLPHIGGMAHAFNGSLQQAQQVIAQGFVLGMGGALTYTRALQIRRLATALAPEHLVLETDAPDIAPSWLKDDRRNTPDQVLGIAQALADLKGLSLDETILRTGQSAMRVVPKLKALWS